MVDAPLLAEIFAGPALGANFASVSGLDQGPVSALTTGLDPLKKCFARIYTDWRGSCKLPCSSVCRPTSFRAFLLSILLNEIILLGSTVSFTVSLKLCLCRALLARL